MYALYSIKWKLNLDLLTFVTNPSCKKKIEDSSADKIFGNTTNAKYVSTPKLMDVHYIEGSSENAVNLILLQR